FSSTLLLTLILMTPTGGDFHFLLFSGAAHRLGSLMALPASMALPKISQHPLNQLNLLPIFSTAGRFG
ncbi:MAG: hypothetical protein ACPIDW_04850, partial [Candidatus Puniceispirillaceae bacterium]